MIFPKQLLEMCFFVYYDSYKLKTRQIKKACLNNKITPHTFRHAFATMLLNEGCDLKSVQELLGHVNLSTTSIYTHITNDRIKDIYLHTHPRSKK